MNKFKKFCNDHGQDTEITDLGIEHLDALLAVFIKGVKKDDGGEYEPMSVYSLSGSIRKYLADNLIGVDAETSFPITKSALQRKKKELKSLGKGNRPNRAECLTDADEEHLWETGTLGDSSPMVLLHTMW